MAHIRMEKLILIDDNIHETETVEFAVAPSHRQIDIHGVQKTETHAKPFFFFCFIDRVTDGSPEIQK